MSVEKNAVKSISVDATQILLITTYLLLQAMFGWHRLLHNTVAFLHAHALVLHLSFPLALHPHLVNPWPPQTEMLLTAFFSTDILHMTLNKPRTSLVTFANFIFVSFNILSRPLCPVNT